MTQMPKPLHLRAALIAGAALLASCASTREAEVTRFHLGQPVNRSAVFITSANPNAASSLEFRTYATAVSEELRQLGFTPAPSLAQADLVGVLDVSQTTRESLSRGSGVSIGIGGGTFGRHVGIGGGVTLPVGGRKANDVAVDTLSFQLKRRSDNSVVWEGRAVTEGRTGTQEDALGTVVPALADALFRDFPGPSGRTVRVRL
jgi:hypothetical protein